MSGQVSQLQSQLRSMLDQPALERIGSETGVVDAKSHRRAVNIVLSPVVENLHDFARSKHGHRVLTDMVDGMASGGVNGAALANHLFADQLPNTAQRLASECSITVAQGRATVDATSAWALTTAASIVPSPLDLPNRFAQQPLPTPVRQVQTPDPAPRANPAPVSKPEVLTSTPLGSSADGSSNRNGMTGKLVGAGLAALLVVGGIFLLTSGGDDDSPVELATQQPAEEQAAGESISDDVADESDVAPPEPTPVQAAPAEAAPADTDDGDTDDSDADDEPSEAAVVAVSNTGTALTVPLRDISDRASDAAGAIDLTFEAETGQICYDVTSVGANPPYAAQIYAGDFGAQGNLVADLGELDAGSQGCIDNPPASTQAILAEPSRHYANLHDAAGGWGLRGQLSETVDQPGIVPFSIPIANSGTLEIGFDTRTGEICHDVSATGIDTAFSSEIHSGKMGVTGDVLVDLGTVEDASTGCIDNAIDATLAILADPSGHYAELRDANNEWSLRGQLAMANAAIDPVPTEITIDTTGGGASLRLEGGTVFLEGDVASERVAAEMLSWLDEVIAPIENNLNIVDGAPAPSGRVVLADGLTFETGSAVLADVEPNTALALLQLANSHPDWLITIVGHTDNVGSDSYNAELSLSRADALRVLMLETAGFAPERVSVRGAGASEPIASNDTEAGRAKNRRLEFEFRPPT